MNRQLLIANRSLPLEFSATGLPARLHLVPRGELPNKVAGVVQVLDDQALDSILADLRNTKAKNGGLYLGEEHFIYNSEMSSQAFAWAKEFEKDSQGIWATAYEPTDVGATALKNKRFKWTSFVADAEQPGAVQALGNGRVRILKIDTVGFTNFPNGKALLTPLSNRAVPDNGCCPDCQTKLVFGANDQAYCPDCKKDFADSQAEVRPGASAANQQKNNQVKNRMKTIATKLGLAAEASEDALLAEVTKIINRATTAEAEVTPLKNRVTALETENQTLLGEQVDGILAEHKITDTKIINRLRPALIPLKNREDRLAYISDLGLKPAVAAEGQRQNLLNRQDGGNGTQAHADTAAQANQAENEVQNYKLQNRCSYEDARNAVRRSKPELFGLK